MASHETSRHQECAEEPPKSDSDRSSIPRKLELSSLQLRDIRKIFSLRKVNYYLFANEIAIPVPNYLWASINRLALLRNLHESTNSRPFAQFVVDQLLISALYEEAQKFGFDAECGDLYHKHYPIGLQLQRGVSFASQVQYEDITYLLSSQVDTGVCGSHIADILGFHWLAVCADTIETMQIASSQLAAAMGIVHQHKTDRSLTDSRINKSSQGPAERAKEGDVRSAKQPSETGQDSTLQKERNSASPAHGPSTSQLPRQPLDTRPDPTSLTAPLVRRKSAWPPNRASVSTLREIFEHHDNGSAEAKHKHPDDVLVRLKRKQTQRSTVPPLQAKNKLADAQAPVHGLVTDGRFFRFARIDKFGWWMMSRELDWEGSDSARIYTILRLLMREILILSSPKTLK